MSQQPETKSESKKNLKDTLNLPRTDFPIRAQAKIDDPLMLARWQKEDIYAKTFELNKGAQKFILHDGPPYANGHMHLGHAYNNILKDIVTKSQRMQGKHVPVTPGWDCHGLPIELKVTQQNPELKGAELKKACRAYAQHWVAVQGEERKSFGVFMNWANPYLTMNFDYEANILRAFGQFVGAGYIARKNKTVPWCSSCKTVLATAEIEYQERKDPSIYVQFPLEQASAKRAFPGLANRLATQEISVLIWTTTPWTLPLNRAVLMRPKTPYVVLDINGSLVIVGAQLADKLCAQLNVEKFVLAEFISDTLTDAQARAHHPFIEGLTVPLLLDDSVLVDDGTAFVHCAPGAGPEDYEVGVKNKLDIFSPVGPDGRYTAAIQPAELAGMPIADGQIWVLKKLTELNRLLYKTSIRHPYPHCWRCRNGLIFRATKQWFCDLSQHNLKQRALIATDSIETVPEKSIARLKATLEGRLEWCLSRQRTWGVPIPALICQSCDHTYTSQDFISSVADSVEKHGIEYWDTVSINQIQADVLKAENQAHVQNSELWDPASAELVELQRSSKQFVCPACSGTAFKKEMDILDVWFDSGVSHYAVLKENPDLAFPADMYLEGKDQHRGWFQSSLLTSMVLNDKPSMKTILTHGFTVDDKGRKMSKSLDNGVLPQEIIDKIGTDGLRLWVSSIDCSGEAVVSEALLQNVQEVFRKIRNTCRFLISNLYDFDIDTDAVEFDRLLLIDQYALQELFQINHKIITQYKAYDFTAVFHTLGDYCAGSLSSLYLDIAKNRLYVDKVNGLERRSAQTACWYILDTLTRLMAPILSFTAEQLSDNYQKNKQHSIHLTNFSTLSGVWETLVKDRVIERPGIDGLLAAGGDVETLGAVDKIVFDARHQERWDLVASIRSALLKALEEQREQGIIKHSLEAKVTVCFDSMANYAPILHAFFAELRANGETPELFFKELVIVSVFDMVTKPETQSGDLQPSIFAGMWVGVTRAAGEKCPRCWQWHEDKHAENLCARCHAIV